uniref:Uncharacterized protein n=1 Tax=Anguilla anguilla TaxID=7936 RepID=A0A0E9PIY5_ANGAN
MQTLSTRVCKVCNDSNYLLLELFLLLFSVSGYPFLCRCCRVT